MFGVRSLLSVEEVLMNSDLSMQPAISSQCHFLLCDASTERGDATVSRLSVRLSVRDDQVSRSHRLEFFENNFTAK